MVLPLLRVAAEVLLSSDVTSVGSSIIPRRMLALGEDPVDLVDGL